MIIRQAVPDDILPMVDMGKLMWAEGVFKITKEYSYEDSFRFALSAIEQSLAGKDFFVQVAHHEDSPEILTGMVIGQFVPYFMNKSVGFAVDHVVYVAEEHRGSSIAYRVTRNFEDWAREKGALEVSLGVSTGIHPEKTDRFYTKMGYKRVGGIYKKPLQEI